MEKKKKIVENSMRTEMHAIHSLFDMWLVFVNGDKNNMSRERPFPYGTLLLLPVVRQLSFQLFFSITHTQYRA